MKDKIFEGIRETVHGAIEDTNRYWRDILKLRVGEEITEEMIDALYDFSKRTNDEFIGKNEN